MSKESETPNLHGTMPHHDGAWTQARPRAVGVPAGNRPDYLAANQRALQAWRQPHPSFANGRDARSSDNGLLLLLYGNLARAAGQDWLNAGRTLVDKTYLRMLFTCARLDAQGLSMDELASRTDAAIREAIRPRWPDLVAGQATVADSEHLITTFAEALFGLPDARDACSTLLFYLCPDLPLIPESAAMRAALKAAGQDGGSVQSSANAQLAGLPLLPYPSEFCGSSPERTAIQQLLRRSDWWQRRVLVDEMQHGSREAP